MINSQEIVRKSVQEVMTLVKQISERGVDGWLSPGEGSVLYMAAQSCKGEGVIVEIGSWKGLSTIFIAKGSKAGNNITVYAIDPHTGSSEHKKNDSNIDTFEELKRNINIFSIDDIVVPLRATSAEIAKEWDTPIELIFIDGAHEYKLVKHDFDSWYPHLIEDGMIAMHDTTGVPGPTKVAKDEIITSGRFYDIRIAGSITFGRKKEVKAEEKSDIQ